MALIVIAAVIANSMLTIYALIIWYAVIPMWKSGPLRQHAEEYIAAVEAGDIERVLELSDELDDGYLDAGVRERGVTLSDALLTAEVLMNAKERISDVVIRSVRVEPLGRGKRNDPTSPNDGYVMVAFTLGSETYTQGMNYVHVDGAWVLRKGLIGILHLECAPGPGVSVQIADVDVDPNLLDPVLEEFTIDGSSPEEEGMYPCYSSYVALIFGVYRVQMLPDPSIEMMWQNQQNATISGAYRYELISISYDQLREPRSWSDE
ncbi:MAG: hypothetical protein FWD18_10035 [Micrococcales bacterium]|nr:hypothetical protein [Micrococcales bacterium]